MDLTNKIISILSDSKERNTIRVEELCEGNLILSGVIKIAYRVYNEHYELGGYFCDVSCDVDLTDLDLVDEDGKSYDFELDEDEIIEFLNNE